MIATADPPPLGPADQLRLIVSDVAALDFDGGDCTVVDADDEFAVDCLGHRAPLSWVGDGACDNGVYEHNGKWINFNCAEAGWDGGDCADPVRGRR